jgi:phytol kinase
VNAVLAGAAALAGLSVLLAGASRLRRSGKIGPETARKAVHVGMGAICLPFPWLFGDARAVMLLAAVAAGALLILRGLPVLRSAFGCALHDVRRRTYGELAYVIGIAALFAFAAGDALVYVIPVAVLTFADPAAALVGMHCTRHRYATRDGSKSVGGSLAFFGTAALCVTLPLLVAGRPGAVAAGIIAGAVLMLVEAAAWAGLDNLTIPLAGGILVRSLDGALSLGGLR